MNRSNGFGVFVLCSIVALCFADNGGAVQWMDSGYFLGSAHEGVYFDDGLSAQSHPLYHVVTVAVAAAFGSNGLAVLNGLLLFPIALLVIRITRTLGGSLNSGLFAACTTCLAHSVFWISTKVEVYSLNLLLILACYWIVFDTGLPLRPQLRMLSLGILTGLGLAVHQLTLLCVAPLYLYACWIYRASSVVSIAGFLAGLAPCYPGLIEELHHGRPIVAIVREYLTSATPSSSAYENSLFRFDRIWATKAYAAIALLSLFGPQAIGLLYPKDPRERTVWCAAVINLGFAVSYDVADRFTFFLPGAALLAILAWNRIDRAFPASLRRALLSAVAVAMMPATLILGYLASENGLVRFPKNDHVLPFRNDVKYFLAPYLPDDSALQFVRAYERLVPPGAIVFSDWTPLAALQSAQATGKFDRRVLMRCEDYPSWARRSPSRSAYVVRIEAGCENVGFGVPSPVDIGFLIPAREPSTTSQVF